MQIDRLWVVLRRSQDSLAISDYTTPGESPYFLGGLQKDNVIRFFTEQGEAESLAREMNKRLARPSEVAAAVEKWRREG